VCAMSLAPRNPRETMETGLAVQIQKYPANV
jgi:hypothetical protein